MGRYRNVLSAPRVRPLTLAALLARLPISMGAVGLILFVHDQTGSFGSAGIVTGAFTIGIGVTGPILARLIDRRGTRPVIVPGAILTAVGLVAVVVLGKEGAGTVPLLVAAAIAGAGSPPVGSVLRQHWPQLVPEQDLETAYALDAVSMELIFVTGPLLAGILAATAGPAVALLTAAALGAAGTLAFDRFLAVPPGSDPDAERHWLGAMRSPTLAVLVFAGVPLGGCFGAIDVTLPAFGAHYASAALGGPLTAALASGSALGGIAWGARPGIFGPPPRAVVKLGGLMALTCLPLVFATAVPEMFVFAALAGICIAPQISVRNNLANTTLAAGTVTEAFTWLSLASTVGASAGAAAVGPLVEAHGWRAGAICVVLLPAVATLVLFLRRDLLSPAPRPARPLPGPSLVDRRGRGRQDRLMPETIKVDPSASLGASFADALAAKDFDVIRELLHPEIDFRGLTPRRNWEASAPEEVIASVLRQWFEDSDEIEELEQVETDSFADRERVAYRFRIRNPEGLFRVEQQVYLSERDGRIGWMRTLCSGYRPIEEG